MIHVREVGLKQASDQEIWLWAKENCRTVITTDADFVALMTRHGPPPKLIHLERCDFPFRVIEETASPKCLSLSQIPKQLR